MSDLFWPVPAIERVGPVRAVVPLLLQRHGPVGAVAGLQVALRVTRHANHQTFQGAPAQLDLGVHPPDGKRGVYWGLRRRRRRGQR